MSESTRKKHWEHIYWTKNLKEMSWYQPTPLTSLQIIEGLELQKNCKIIDIGGGDSLFVDHLLDLGYSDITVLDISEKAIERAQVRLGKKSELVKWVISDIVDFTPSVQYDLWHDRAAFHFLTEDNDIKQYIITISKAIKSCGVLVLATFSEDGPKRCSGIEIHQYSEKTISDLLSGKFQKNECLNVEHQTPSGNPQNYVFCSFLKI